MIDNIAEGWGEYTRNNGDKYIGWVCFNNTSGTMDCNTVKDKKYTQMALHTWVHLKEVRNMD
jgi:hypothetical protein